MPSVSDVRVAEPETKARPPPLYDANESWTSWLPAGPATAQTRLSDASVFAALIASATFGSCVSPWTILNFGFADDLFHRVTANCAQCSCWTPIEDAAPVIGAATPMYIVLPHLEVAAAGAAAAADSAGAVRVRGRRGDGDDRQRRSDQQGDPCLALHVMPSLSFRVAVLG